MDTKSQARADVKDKQNLRYRGGVQGINRGVRFGCHRKNSSHVFFLNRDIKLVACNYVFKSSYVLIPKKLK